MHIAEEPLELCGSHIAAAQAAGFSLSDIRKLKVRDLHRWKLQDQVLLPAIGGMHQLWELSVQGSYNGAEHRAARIDSGDAASDLRAERKRCPRCARAAQPDDTRVCT
jgi:hypothetical protein